jgi:hypothetical protein
MLTKIRTVKQNHSNKRTTSVYAKDDAIAEDKNNKKFMRARSGGETDKKEKGVNYSIQPNHIVIEKTKRIKGAIFNLAFSPFFH